MDMTSPEKNWDERLARARQLAPPADIDVRFAVRRALEAEIALGREARTSGKLWREVTDLSGTIWLRGLLGGGMLAAIPFWTTAWQAARELLDVARMAGPTLLGF